MGEPEFVETCGDGEQRELGVGDEQSKESFYTQRELGEEFFRRRVRIAGAVVICIGVAIIALTVVLVSVSGAKSFKSTSQSRNLQSPIGWVAVVGAVILFGSCGIMFKEPPQKQQPGDHEEEAPRTSSPPDPVLFQAFNACGIFTAAIPLLLYEVAMCVKEGDSPFHFFDPLGIVGAVDILVICYLAARAVRLIGYSTAPAIWSGVGMVTAFIWGLIAFGEEVANMYLATAALLLLITGVLNVARIKQLSSQSPSTGVDSDHQYEVKHQLVPAIVEEGKEVREMIRIPTTVVSDIGENEAEEGKEREEEGDNTKMRGWTETESLAERSVIKGSEGDRHQDSCSAHARSLTCSSSGSMLGGFGLCVLTGLLDGSLMVPYKMHLAGKRSVTEEGENSLRTTFAYLASFGLGALITIPWLVFLAFWQSRCALHRQRGVSANNQSFCTHFASKLHRAAVPGLVTGILWTMGNFLSVHATEYLGMSVGFPLTQTCILINASWGIFFFHEIDLRSNRGQLFRFLLALCTIIAGAALLSQAAKA